MQLTDADLQEILRVLEASPYGELRLETADLELVLRRGSDGMWLRSTTIRTEPRVREAMAARSTGAAHAAAETKADAGEPHLVAVPAPLLGTFYRAPQPGAPPFVEIGSRVEPDTVVGIVETMKLMNSVCAGVCGSVVEICAQDAEFVDAAAVLMRIETTVS